VRNSAFSPVYLIDIKLCTKASYHTWYIINVTREQQKVKF